MMLILWYMDTIVNRPQILNCIKLTIWGALAVLLAAHSFGKLDPISADRVNDYIHGAVLPENLNKSKLDGLWYDPASKSWKTGRNSNIEAIYERFASLTYDECQSWDYADPESQLFLYWLNDVALLRKDAKLSDSQALDLLTQTVRGSGAEYPDLWIPLEAVLNSGALGEPANIYLATGSGTEFYPKKYDFEGVNMSLFSDSNQLRFSNSYCNGVPQIPRGYSNPFECLKNLSMSDFLSDKIKLSGSFDLSGFTSDQISNMPSGKFMSITGLKLDKNKSLYDSAGRYILEGKSVAGMDFRGFTEFNVELMKSASYRNCKFSEMTLSPDDNLSGVKLSFCDFRYVKGLTEDHLRQIGIPKLECLMFSKAQYEEHKGFFNENKETIKRIYIDGTIFWLYRN